VYNTLTVVQSTSVYFGRPACANVDLRICGVRASSADTYPCSKRKIFSPPSPDVLFPVTTSPVKPRFRNYARKATQTACVIFYALQRSQRSQCTQREIRNMALRRDRTCPIFTQATQELTIVNRWNLSREQWQRSNNETIHDRDRRFR